MSIDVTTYALAKKYTDKKIVEAGFGEGAELPKIYNGEGVNSLEQAKDTNTWGSNNETVQLYVQDSIPGANNKALVRGTAHPDGSVTI